MKRTWFGRRKKPLARKPWPKKAPTPRTTQAPARRSSKPKKPGETRARRLVAKRSDGVCELQIAGICEGRATNFSHRLPEGQGGPWSAANGVAACGMGNASGCHGYIENHRTEAYAKGWLLKRGQDPTRVPVVLWPMGKVQLHDDGSWTQLHPDDLPAITYDDTQQEGAA